MNLYEASFSRMVASLQEAGCYLPRSALRHGTWTIVVNPRPFCVFRIRYHSDSSELTVCRRRPFIYREILRETLGTGSLDKTIRETPALLGPARAI
jgi:hypothetical protein